MHGYLACEGKTARGIIDENKAMPGALLAIPHALQETFGDIDLQAEPLIAGTMNMSCSDVRGAIAFHHDFRLRSPATHELKLCRAEARHFMAGNDRRVGFGPIAVSDVESVLDPALSNAEHPFYLGVSVAAGRVSFPTSTMRGNCS